MTEWGLQYCSASRNYWHSQYFTPTQQYQHREGMIDLSGWLLSALSYRHHKLARYWRCLPYSHPSIGYISSLPPFSSAAVHADEKTYQWKNELTKKKKKVLKRLYVALQPATSEAEGVCSRRLCDFCLLSLIPILCLKIKFNNTSVFQWRLLKY